MKRGLLTPAYDPAGNTTTFPQGGDPTKAFNTTYDAWNRLRKIVDPAVGPPGTGRGNVASYEYEARDFSDASTHS